MLSDLICRLDVAARGHIKSIEVPISKLDLAVLDILYKHGLIRGFLLKKNKIRVYLKYYGTKPVCKLRLISKPSKKEYSSLHKLSLHYNNITAFTGFYIISTNKGLLTSTDCLLNKAICGEILLKVFV
jgi:small subunit ribosomal protein S8